MLNYKRPPLSQDSAAYTVTSLRTGQPEKRGSSSYTDKTFIPSSNVQTSTGNKPASY